MYAVPVAGALWLAVGPRLERRVRQRCGERAGAGMPTRCYLWWSAPGLSRSALRKMVRHVLQPPQLMSGKRRLWLRRPDELTGDPRCRSGTDGDVAQRFLVFLVQAPRSALASVTEVAASRLFEEGVATVQYEASGDR